MQSMNQIKNWMSSLDFGSNQPHLMALQSLLKEFWESSINIWSILPLQPMAAALLLLHSLLQPSLSLTTSAGCPFSAARPLLHQLPGWFPNGRSGRHLQAIGRGWVSVLALPGHMVKDGGFSCWSDTCSKTDRSSFHREQPFSCFCGFLLEHNVGV